MKNIDICKICKHEFKRYSNTNGLKKHLMKVHNIDFRTYYDNYIRDYGSGEGFCKNCGKQLKFTKRKYGKFCDSSCSLSYRNKNTRYNLQYYIDKYGEEKGVLIHKEISDKKSSSLNSFIKRHGEKEGKKRYNNHCKKSANTLDNFIRVYGQTIGKEKWNEYLLKLKKRGNSTLKKLIKEYGFESGNEKYNDYLVERGKSRTLNGFIKKYGKEKGTELYHKMCKSISNSKSLKAYIEKYGKEEGTKKHLKTYSKALKSIKTDSHDQIELENWVKSKFKDLKIFGHKEKFFIPFNLEEISISGLKVVYPDIFIFDYNLIIEYKGIYWHGHPDYFPNDEVNNRDMLRENILLNKGYKILSIWENDWNKDKEYCKSVIIEFINSNIGKSSTTRA